MSGPAAESPQHPPSREDEGEERIGLFPSWKSLYATVVVYGVVVILILYILTIVLGSGSL
jgi:hypothetical protein